MVDSGATTTIRRLQIPGLPDAYPLRRVERLRQRRLDGQSAVEFDSAMNGEELMDDVTLRPGKLNRNKILEARRQNFA
ncbi:hypothetical protein KIN20_027046 [Parelaphostrongylus tenuis]|uniref:Uncharacterized protein n=1 Tax=Parelaphostrongylus tenuis TaxID=148309 RepID=A0AAD5WDI8_PARTN|nr:hypothetical protein KIN20_027046 [Parelaphostrongylus tenuis]